MDRSSPGALPPVRTRVLDLPGRGRTVVEDFPGPPGAPTLVLLHGVALTAELNWDGIVEPLRADYHVVMLDLCGHGKGVRTSAFRLEDCADDVAAVAAELGIERLIAVGYSMGGLVAQLLWRRHPALVSGLVLCSTARNVSGSPWERTTALTLPFLVAAAAWMPVMHVLRADLLGAALLDHEINPADRQRALSQMRRTTLIDALSAVQAVTGFTSHTWINTVDVPAAVIITRHDRIIPRTANTNSRKHCPTAPQSRSTAATTYSSRHPAASPPPSRQHAPQCAQTRPTGPSARERAGSPPPHISALINPRTSARQFV